MYTGRNYPFWQTVSWTKKYIFQFFLIGLIPVLLRKLIPEFDIPLPWLPISLVGIAVAFYLGFKNNASYDRLWEARKIWGGIVNDSRTWAMMVRGYVRMNYVTTQEAHAIQLRLIKRHLAWLHALRFQLRTKKQWEHTVGAKSDSHAPQTEERMLNKLEIVSNYITTEELQRISKKKNAATQLLDLQMDDLTALRKSEYIEDFRHIELGTLLRTFYALQSKCERIKNFPFPRQYASLNIYFVWIFIILLPFGLVQEFAKFGDPYIWLALPISVLISWVFHTMEMIGDYSENPFEGLNNDIPITALTRTIEIDMLEMIDYDEIPDGLTAKDNILM